MTFQSYNPANGNLVWEGPMATAEEIDKTIQLSYQAFEYWSLLPLEKRIEYLKKFEECLKQEQKELAEVIAQETGKPLWESLTEVAAMSGKIDISIRAYHQRCAVMEQKAPIGTSFTRHKPHGPIAVFGPYNFPGHLPNGHIVPALLAGNTVIFKPSELTPAVAEKTLQLWQKAGLPPHVLTLVQGGKETGKNLAKHPFLKGLFFTGSWPTGRILSESFANHPEKILALEMGGNNPYIIDEHIQDWKAAAYLTLQSGYITTGQRCTCARRLIILEKAYHPLIEELQNYLQQIKIGSYEETPEPFMGPLISEASAISLTEKFQRLIDLGGQPLKDLKHLKKGTGFVSPGLIDVTSIAHLPDEEYFGPLLQVIRVKNLEEALERANQTAYGLAAGILTDHPKAYEMFYQKIHAGIVNWNTPLTGASSSAPFGGIGHSGNHRPSAYYAADYCAYPVASLEKSSVILPEKLTPGIQGA